MVELRKGWSGRRLPDLVPRTSNGETLPGQGSSGTGNWLVSVAGFLSGVVFGGNHDGVAAGALGFVQRQVGPLAQAAETFAGS